MINMEGDNDMNSKELEAVIKIPANKRYEYFIKKVVSWEEVWGLYDDGWAMTEDDDGNRMIPFWPRKEFAELCTVDGWEDYSPESIDLYEFIDKWLPSMKEDGIKPSIFWNNVDSAVLDIDVIVRDLNTELENY
jgi:hypothetical protein